MKDNLNLKKLPRNISPNPKSQIFYTLPSEALEKPL
jgi:hypothetical protein